MHVLSLLLIAQSQSSPNDLAPKFFEECESYWAPSSSASELYEQLSRKQYREIPRQHVQ